jgi:hypothetical protein
MDHVSANKSLTVTERENISGCRVFDGEDQGKFKFASLPITYFFNLNLLTSFLKRRGKQVPHATVTTARLV